MRATSRNTLFAVYSLALIAVMASPIRALIAYALDTEHTHASQIVLIPFISGTLIYLNRKSIFAKVQYAVAPAAFVIVAGLALLIAAKTVGLRFEVGDQLAFLASALVMLWLGGFLLCFGTAAFRSALFPLLFLVFCIPIPSIILTRVVATLQLWSANMAYVLIRLSGTPILRQGMFFKLPNLVIEVAPECSGIRSGISIVISGLLAGHLFLRSTWRRGLLVLIAVPVLIFKNALRIGTLAYLAVHVDERILKSHLHQEGGIPFFVLGLILLYPVLAMLIKSESRSPLHLTRGNS